MTHQRRWVTPAVVALAVLIVCPARAAEDNVLIRHEVRVEMRAAGPGREPQVRMWINGREVDPGRPAAVAEGKARVRIQAMPAGRRRDEVREAPAVVQAVLGVHPGELGVGAERGGVAVTGVVEGSPAQRAGLREGDEITAVDGRQVRSPTELAERIRRHRPGERVRIEWWRPGARIEATVALAGRDELVPEEGRRIRPRDEGEREARRGEQRRREDREAREREERDRREAEQREERREEGEEARRRRPRDEEREEARRRDEAEAREHRREDRERGEGGRGERPGGFLGILAAPLNDDIREIAGTDEGVLINSLTDGSPAAKAGLLPGDVIVRIGDADIHSVDQLVETLRGRKPGERVHVVYYREGKRRETDVTLGRRPGDEEKQAEEEAFPLFDELFGGEVPSLREYLERLRPEMEEWARTFREQRSRQRDRPEGVRPRRPGEPFGMGQDLGRIMERLDRIERRLERIEDRLERAER